MTPRKIQIHAEITMKFNPGNIVVTRAVNDLIANDEEFALHAFLSLNRHIAGDWGDLCEEDRAENESALLNGERLFSAYKKEGSVPIWIITERDRSVTTILFPHEY